MPGTFIDVEVSDEIRGDAELAKKLVQEWLSLEFDPASTSAEKLAVISEYEAEHGV